MDLCLLWNCDGYGIVLAMEMCSLCNCVGCGIILAMELCWIWKCVGYGNVLAMELCWLWKCVVYGIVMSKEMCWLWKFYFQTKLKYLINKICCGSFKNDDIVNHFKGRMRHSRIFYYEIVRRQLLRQRQCNAGC